MWWMVGTNNWNFVCNGGGSLAAMAVLDEMPEECSDILHTAFQCIQTPLKHFEPDGAWWEGIGYWGYSMRYLLSYLRGLETAVDIFDLRLALDPQQLGGQPFDAPAQALVPRAVGVGDDVIPAGLHLLGR